MLPQPLTPRNITRGPVGPSSPPQTPSTASPVGSRKATAGGHPHGRATATNRQFACPTPPAPLHGKGPRPNFLAGGFRPDQLSPRSTESSEGEDGDDDDDDEDEEEEEDDDGDDDEIKEDDDDDEGDDEADDSDTDSSLSRSRAGSLGSTQSDLPMSPIIVTARVVVNYDLVIVECNDSDSDHGLPILRPHHIEYADSDRSRSRSRHQEAVNSATAGIQELAVESESETDGETEFDKQRQRLRSERRHRRLTSGSIGKRTITESIGSASDREDLGPLGVDDLGSSARRLRRRLDRRSLQFQDPPPERIEELDEPPTSDDDMNIEYGDWEFLAKELPYYTYISMEVDSP